MKKAQDIYDLFSLELDGETFDSETDALIEINVSYRDLINERDWNILKKSYTLPAGTTSLSVIADLDKVLAVWYDGYELKKANFNQRFDTDFDYWIDYANNTINFINEGQFDNVDITVDYKYSPDDFEDLEDEIVFPDIAYPVISYDIILSYKEKDTDPDFYSQIERKREKAFNLLVNWNESLYA